MGDPISFDSRFNDTTEPEFFFHTVDQAACALKVQVLGLNLTQTFSHLNPPGKKTTEDVLRKKTTGFLTAVTDSGKRVVLAWAESGHGIGRHGDSLLPQNHVLQNRIWARRAMQLAKVLDINMSSLFDRGDRPGAGPPGSFQAAHVEVKLATHAVAVLLRLSKEAAGNGRQNECSITKQALLKLRQHKWKHDKRIHFEVYVSRKNCHRCGLFLQRLQEVTGVRFDLQWKERLVVIEYEKRAIIEVEQQSSSSSSSSLTSKPAAPALDTYEKDGIIYYVNPLSSNEEDNTTNLPLLTEEESTKLEQRPGISRQSAPPRISIHHLSNVDKPLPATPVTEAPGWDGGSQATSSQSSEKDSALHESDGFPFPMRSPRPYTMQLGDLESESAGGCCFPFPMRSPRPYAMQLG